MPTLQRLADNVVTWCWGGAVAREHLRGRLSECAAPGELTAELALCGGRSRSAIRLPVTGQTRSVRSERGPEPAHRHRHEVEPGRVTEQSLAGAMPVEHRSCGFYGGEPIEGLVAAQSSAPGDAGSRSGRECQAAPMFLLLALLLLVVLPSPWNVVGALASGALFVLEIGYWQRRVRRQKVHTGVENLLGATGEVTEPLARLRQIRVMGELWQARSSSDITPGSHVRVLGVDGLVLEVESAEDSPTSRRPAP